MPYNQKTKQFVEALKKVNVQGIWDMGLAVANDENKKEIAESLKTEAGDSEIFNFVSQSSPEDFLETLAGTLQSKKWLIVVLSGGRIDGKIYSALRGLATNNRLQILHFKDKEELNLKQPLESRVVFVASWRNIKELNLPEFMKLFGPVLDLTEERRER